MALDAAMLDLARATGQTVVRVYSWLSPTLSFGRNQTAAGRYDLERLRAEGIDIVRRQTGGRAILHWREVTYSVAAPIAQGSLRRSYDRINRLLLHALQRLGVPAAIASAIERETPPGPVPCFDHPSDGELVAQGRKLVGSAQWREGGAFLQHGSILLADDQSAIADLLREAPAAPRPPATLGELLGRLPQPEEVAEAIFASVRELECPAATSLAVTELEAESSRWVKQFADPSWTWRR